jgi:hypothetical protein
MFVVLPFGDYAALRKISDRLFATIAYLDAGKGVAWADIARIAAPHSYIQKLSR